MVERSADLVGELAGERSQVAGVLVEARRVAWRSRAPRRRAHPGARFREFRNEPSASERGFARASQPREPHCEPRREREHGNDGHRS